MLQVLGMLTLEVLENEGVPILACRCLQFESLCFLSFLALCEHPCCYVNPSIQSDWQALVVGTIINVPYSEPLMFRTCLSNLCCLVSLSVPM